jgi:hypothetical protein
MMGIAINEMRILMLGANILATDVDPNVFKNRFEGTEELKNIGSSWNPVFWQTIKLKANTFKSFLESKKYFSEVGKEK